MTTIGISGIGSIGSRHARVLGTLAGVDLVVFDPFATEENIAERVGLPVRRVPSYEDLLAAGIDGIVVATPDDSHADQVISACGLGIPVLVEKPVADTVDHGRAILAAAERSGTPVLVGYVLHYVSCFRRAAELLAAGAIGAPVSFQVMLGAYETLQYARNRFGPGVRDTLYVDYSHEWDYLRWFIAPVVGGYALARTAGELELRQSPNVLDAVLRLADGTTGTAHVDYVQLPGARRCTIVGDQGTLHLDGGTQRVTVTPRTGEEARVQVFAEERDVSFRAQAMHFLEVIAGACPPAVDLAAGMAALQTADALRRSVEERRWIDIN